MKTYKLKEIIDKIGNYGFCNIDEKIIIIGNITITLKENYYLIQLLIERNVDEIKKQFGSIEVEELSENEYKQNN